MSFSTTSRESSVILPGGNIEATIGELTVLSRNDDGQDKYSHTRDKARKKCQSI